MKKITVPVEVIEFTKTIMDENHNVLNPKVYLKHRFENEEFEESLKKLIGCDKVDWVLFSSRSGAEEHVDTHLKHLDIYTYIIPVVMDYDNITILNECDYGSTLLEEGFAYRINHQEPHSLSVTNDSPLVLCMASKVL